MATTGSIVQKTWDNSGTIVVEYISSSMTVPPGSITWDASKLNATIATKATCDNAILYQYSGTPQPNTIGAVFEVLPVVKP